MAPPPVRIASGKGSFFERDISGKKPAPTDYVLGSESHSGDVSGRKSVVMN